MPRLHINGFLCLRMSGNFVSQNSSISLEPRHEKTGLSGIRPGPM